MLLFPTLLVLLSPVFAPAEPQTILNTRSPFAPGTYSVSNFNIGSTADPELSLSPWHANVFYPSGRNKPGNSSVTFPVVLFVSGFGGEYAIGAYSSVLSKMAAHGMVVVGLDRKFKLSSSVNYTDLAEHLGGVLDFITSGLDTGLSARLRTLIPPNTQANTSAIIIGGHSAGNHVTVRRLVSFGCGPIAGVMMLDPVDGEDPYGIVKIYVIHPPRKVNFVVPALHIETGLDPSKASPITPPCAPANMSNGRFFDAWRGPIYQMNATNMGHMDLANWKGGGLAKLVCASKKNQTAIQLYQQTIAAAAAAFAKGLIVEGNMVTSGADALLTGESGTQAPVQLLYRQKLPVEPGRIRAGCTMV